MTSIQVLVANLEHVLHNMGKVDVEGFSKSEPVSLNTAALQKHPSPTIEQKRYTKIRNLVTQAGGIFLEGEVGPDIALPKKLTKEFLDSADPKRGNKIAAHVIIGFDNETKKWYCISRGNGGMSDVLPGSLGMTGVQHDQLFRNSDNSDIVVKGLKLDSPKDYAPYKRLLDRAVTAHLETGGKLETAPFYGVWGRTNDTEHGAAGCRVLLGYADECGVLVRAGYLSFIALSGVGAFAVWNLNT
jgi:hypothetical protein